MLRIALTEKDFQDLVSGRIIQRHEIEIVLQEIGFEKVIECVYTAQGESWLRQETERRD